LKILLTLKTIYHLSFLYFWSGLIIVGQTKKVFKRERQGQRTSAVCMAHLHIRREGLKHPNSVAGRIVSVIMAIGAAISTSLSARLGATGCGG
jgi:hypothetical protein